jgi:MFS family permease
MIESPKPSRKPFHGYYVAVVVFLSTGLSIGMAQYSFGEFVEPLQEEFGWTQTQLNLSLTFAFISGILAPFVGRLSDRFGTRPVMFASLLLIALGFALRPLISELWHWYLFSSLVYAGFPGATVLPSGKMVGIWFPDKRGTVMGAVTAGNNFGGVTMPPLAATIIAFASWQMAYMGFALIMVVLALVALVVIRESVEDVDAERARTGRTKLPAGSRGSAAGMNLNQAWRTSAFWLVLVGLTAATFTYQGVLTQLRQHFGENGFEPALATSAVTIIAAMGIGSKLAFGRSTERYSARKMTALSIAFQASGVGLMILPGGAPVMWAGILVFGIGFGGLGALIVLVVQETFGLREFGSLMGVFQMATIVSIGGGPWLAGVVHDRNGNFDAAFAAIIGIFALGAVALLLARQPEWGDPPNKLETDATVAQDPVIAD